jgi:acyl-CoA synthetase (AMP-forming)/AMP-acid ligase II
LKPTSGLYYAFRVTATAFLDRWAAEQPRKAALVTLCGSRTFGQLADDVLRLAAGLQRLGLPDGARIGVMLPSGVESIEATLAILRAGYVHVAINPLFTGGEAAQILEDAGAQAMFVDADRSQRIAESRDQLPALETVIAVDGGTGDRGFDELLAAPVDHVPLPPAAAPAALVYTGGTTGAPKGALHDQWNIARQLDAMIEYFGLTQADGAVGALPTFLFPALVMGHLNALAAGATVHTLEHFDAAVALRLIVEERLTFMTGSKTLCWMFNELPPSAAEDLSFMRVMAFGGMYQPLAVREAFEARFNRPTLHCYGMSEGPNLVAGTPLDLEEPVRRAKLESIGLPLEGIEIVVQTEDGTLCGPGESGEICLRPDGSDKWRQMLGYWNRPEETAHAMRGGWYHSGDAGHIDADGFIFVYGRTQDLIKVAGWSVFPAEIETLIASDPRVEEVAVVAVPDEKAGEKPLAFITLRPDAEATGTDFERLVREKLAPFKRLRSAAIVEALPKNVYGKVQKNRLRDMWLEQERVARPPVGQADRTG